MFIGDDINQQKKYERYDNIVVDPSSFKSKQVETLKADGKNVY
ncbi:glucanotransferase [Ligilactobacillus ruminis SPM0211]|uniref:Glucanotransferase n=1 Tax=Ligilactobacillus ruminis SPM0211 TaxID=1040964 RepID=F7QXQ1_9LACO|nr:glucanotransferase [Ligilactobacillus ruminis SPM0211]